MTIPEAKEMDLVDYLSKLGHEPKNIRGINYWYHSPLRVEKDPSFKVNRRLNRWYDFGEGKGGNLVDFGILYHQCSVRDFLQLVKPLSNRIIPRDRFTHAKKTQSVEPPRITILSASEISAYHLLKYLHARRIHPEVANHFCKEVIYKTGDKTYYAIGFQNDRGGYELRSPHFKGSSSPKDSTFIDNGSPGLAVFEGFFNFLSYKTLYYEQPEPTRNYLILNSAAFFEKSIPRMQEHSIVHLFLDNDKTGQKCSQLAIGLDNTKFNDERQLYQKYGDLNDWLVNIGKGERPNLRIKF